HADELRYVRGRQPQRAVGGKDGERDGGRGHDRLLTLPWHQGSGFGFLGTAGQGPARPAAPGGPAWESPAFRQAPQVVRLLAVGLGLDVLVVPPANGDDHVDRAPAPADVEG